MTCLMTVPKKILVLDDDEDVRFLIGVHLGRHGFVVEAAATGEQAIAMYKDAFLSGFCYAAAILDLNIPGGIGGAKVAQEILAIDQGACLFVSSGDENDEVMADACRFGFTGKLPKPFLGAHAAELVKMIP